VPKDQILMQLKTDDIGWAPRIPSIDGLCRNCPAVKQGDALPFFARTQRVRDVGAEAPTIWAYATILFLTRSDLDSSSA
jgi:hypothetical protein